jgi:hypothetical protein
MYGTTSLASLCTRLPSSPPLIRIMFGFCGTSCGESFILLRCLPFCDFEAEALLHALSLGSYAPSFSLSLSLIWRAARIVTSYCVCHGWWW